jgi:hypothetical protein
MKRTCLFAVALGLIAALAAVSNASAQASVKASADISWTPPTTGDGGLYPLTGANALTSYNVYVASVPLTATPATPLATVTVPATTVTGTVPATVGETLYVYVTACNANGCSPLSAAGTIVVPAPKVSPDVPTSVTITLTVTIGP